MSQAQAASRQLRVFARHPANNDPGGNRLRRRVTIKVNLITEFGLLLLAALAPAAQRTPQPVFTVLFACDPTAPSQLLGDSTARPGLIRSTQPAKSGNIADRIQRLAEAT